jgi:hypothetical protein
MCLCNRQFSDIFVHACCSCLGTQFLHKTWWDMIIDKFNTYMNVSNSKEIIVRRCTQWQLVLVCFNYSTINDDLVVLVFCWQLSKTFRIYSRYHWNLIPLWTEWLSSRILTPRDFLSKAVILMGKQGISTFSTSISCSFCRSEARVHFYTLMTTVIWWRYFIVAYMQIIYPVFLSWV